MYFELLLSQLKAHVLFFHHLFLSAVLFLFFLGYIFDTINCCFAIKFELFSRFIMDIFDFRAQRVVDTAGVFDPTPTPLDSGISGLFIRLKNPSASELHTQWDIAFLETYIKEAMVPRSLRWEVCPQKGDLDLEGWFKYFNNSGIGLLWFLIQRNSEKLARLDEEIKNLKANLAPSNSSE